MNGLREDLRHALRVFWNAPAFAAAAVMTLALGIGVNIAVFTVMHSALLAGLPVKHAKDLVNVFSWSPKGGDHTDFSYPLYVDLRDNSPQLAGLAGYTAMGVGVAAGSQTERVLAELVTANYFPLLGVDLPLGPGFAGEDELRGAAPVAVISPRLWQSMFNGDGGVIGKTLQVNGFPARIAGVTPPSFSGFTRGRRVDVWLTVSQYFTLDRGRDRFGSRESSWLSLVGRTRPGAAVEPAQAQMTATLHAKAPEDGPEWSIRTSAAGAGDTSMVSDLDRPLRLLLLVVGLILVIAAANVANLLLTRAYTRQREIAMRTALGASRARIVRQLLIEGVVLSAAGGTVGLFLGVWTAALFDLRTARGSALALTMEPDLAVVGFTALVSALAAVAIGILPALGASRVDLVSVLKGAGGAVSGAVSKRRARTALTLVQIALAMVLVVGAGLFLRSLGKLRAIDPSLATDRVIAAELDLTLRGYDEGKGQQFYSRMLDAVQTVPGVQTATLASVLPVTAGGSRENLRAGATLPKVDVPVEFDIVTVAPGYFATMGVPLVYGRDFVRGDGTGAPPVAIVNESMQRLFWPAGDSVGRTFSAGGPAPYAVVGVARDTKYRNLREKPRMVLYVPLGQSYRSGVNLVVRSALPPAQIVEALRTQVRAIDPAMPLYNVRTLAEHVNRSLYLDRLRANLIGSLALLALALASIGIYAVLSYTIAERTREVGVRLALGAQPFAVLRMLLGSGARVAAAGIGAGLILSFGLTRLVASQLYGLTATDPLTMAAASALLFGVALLAAFIPAWRATRIDPVVALRQR
jgi:putative ABC transport system permease protein